jgi:CubicO group peptidase (beta-lactamase class C family)
MSKTTAVDIQAKVQDAVDRLVDSGAERGLQVAVYRHGELVVDAVAGVADPESGRPVTSATPFYNFSVCKAPASTLIHMLVDRGRIGYDTRLAEVWPEFAAHGKDAVTLRHVLTHTAGVPGIPLTTSVEDLCDWDKMCAAIADEKLWWEPGTKIGYHAYSFGYIVGEIIRRVTGEPISQNLAEEIARPLRIEKEIYFGMPRSEQHRLAVLEDAPMPADVQMPALPPDHPMLKAAPMSLMPNAAFGNRPDVLAADIPAGGKTSARAIAKVYAAMLGEVDGVRLISEKRMREIIASPFSGPDAVFGHGVTTWALGYSVGIVGREPGQPATAIGIGGVGGAFAFGDTATGICCAITKNRLAMDFNSASEIARLVTTFKE